MVQSGGLTVAVTGAAGFIGRAVIDRIERGALGRVAELRLCDVRFFERESAVTLQGSYAVQEVRAQLVGDGVDILFHLASLPGGASERDPKLGKSVNLDGTIALLDTAAAKGGNVGRPVIVYTSSIAALGRSAQPVSDETALRPSGSYGTHKAMIEYYLADLTRRGVVDGRSVRPAGIVARPRHAFAGFATAWMSDLFHAAAEGRDITIPAREEAHIWLQSIDAVADNIVHAALMPANDLPPHRAWTLPATVVHVGSLVEALRLRTGNRFKVEYSDEPTDQPPLNASGALALGFVCDGNTQALVEAVISRIVQH